MMSSCSSEKLWTSSTATPAAHGVRRGSAGGFGAQQDERRSHRLAAAAGHLAAVGVQPAEVVAGDPAHPLVGQAVDGCAQRGLHQRRGRGRGRQARVAIADHALPLRSTGRWTPRCRRATGRSVTRRRARPRPRDAAAHRAFHGVRPAGRRPRAGQPEAGDAGSLRRAAAPRCPAACRNVARRSRVTNASRTVAAPGAGSSRASSAMNCSCSARLGASMTPSRPTP